MHIIRSLGYAWRVMFTFPSIIFITVRRIVALARLDDTDDC